MIILLLSMFYIYTDVYFSSEFIIFNLLHMFVLPDVASSGVAGVRLLLVMFFISDVPCVFAATLHMIFISFICEHDIFINICNIFFKILHILQWIFSHICIVYKVFKWLFSTWCIIFCDSSFLCCISCFCCNCHGWWWYYK